MTPAPHFTSVYLSPHLDDVVLSCGGQIWQQVEAGERVAVETVFAGVPGPSASLSPFAKELHARWSQTTDVVEKRQEEDERALAVVGAEAVHWPYPDCIYRRTPEGEFAYASEEALWGRIHRADQDLLDDVAARLTALRLVLQGRLYVPLGAGGHVDHHLVRRAAERSQRARICYEDYPYAEDWSNVKTALGRSGWKALTVPLSEEALEAKIAAIACYRSQIGSFWADVEEMAAAVRGFAVRIGAGRPAERYWVPT